MDMEFQRVQIEGISRRAYNENCTVSKMFINEINRLILEGKINKDEICAIVVLTNTPDFFVPQVSNIVHGECEFGKDVFCIDITGGNASYVKGLEESFMLLEHKPDGKVLLCTGESWKEYADELQMKKYGLCNGCIVTLLSKGDLDEKVCSFSAISKEKVMCTKKWGFNSLYNFPDKKNTIDIYFENLLDAKEKLEEKLYSSLGTRCENSVSLDITDTKKFYETKLVKEKFEEKRLIIYSYGLSKYMGGIVFPPKKQFRFLE